jgi:hypothetical protein
MDSRGAATSEFAQMPTVTTYAAAVKVYTRWMKVPATEAIKTRPGSVQRSQPSLGR